MVNTQSYKYLWFFLLRVMFWRCRVDLYMLTAHLKRSFLFISELHYHSKSPGGPWIYGPENASPSVNYPCVEPRGTVHWFQYVSLQGKQVHLRAVSFSKKYRVKIETTGLFEWRRATIVAISRTASMTECRKEQKYFKATYNRQSRTRQRNFLYLFSSVTNLTFDRHTRITKAL